MAVRETAYTRVELGDGCCVWCQMGLYSPDNGAGRQWMEVFQRDVHATCVSLELSLLLFRYVWVQAPGPALLLRCAGGSRATSFDARDHTHTTPLGTNADAFEQWFVLLRSKAEE